MDNHKTGPVRGNADPAHNALSTRASLSVGIV